MTDGRMWLLAIVSVVIVSAVPLAGLIMLRREQLLRRMVPHLVSLAVGAMLGSAMLELIPEGTTVLGDTAPILAVAGFVGFFVVEGMLSTHGHRLLRRANAVPIEPYALLSLVGDGIHNALDGAVIAASYVVHPALGVSNHHRRPPPRDSA
ncbi:MAG TPA: ZIP family metal transporter [Gemmatimonadaceae bacterium]|nr:ZIP family metal transporter [Gemmatimonadaceae bacterium]